MSEENVTYILEDEDGKEYEFELLDSIVHNDQTYLAVTEVNSEHDDLLDVADELVILKLTIGENGEDVIATVDDDDEYDEVADIFLDRLEEDYDIEADEETEETEE